MSSRLRILQALGLSLALPLGCVGQVNPLALVERAVKLQESNAVREREMAFRERVLTKDLESDGGVRRSQEKVHDVLLIDATPQRILLEEDGVPQSAAEIAASQGFLKRVVEIRTAESERDRSQRIDAFERKRREYQEAVSEIPHAFQFRLAGEEQIGDHTCYKLLATPREGYQPRNRYGRIFTHTVGTIWIDKATGEWRRVEGELRETVNLGWIFIQIRKGTRAIAEQQPYGEAGWLMSSLWYRSVARVGFFLHYRREQRSDYWNYQKMTPALLARVLGTGYPSGSMHPAAPPAGKSPRANTQ